MKTTDFVLFLVLCCVVFPRCPYTGGGISRVMLQTAEENESARELFKKHGFKMVTRDLMMKIEP